MIRNALTRKVFLWISFHFVAVVFTQEPKCPGRYIEERVFEKMIEMDFKLQKTLEKLEKLESQDRDTCNERASRKRVDSQDCSTCDTNVLKTSDIEVNGWRMVFRATSGNGYSAYHAWTLGENTTPDKPMSMKRSHGPHYRDSIVSSWSDLGFAFVKFAFYDEDKEVAHVIFNGKNSNINNWFNKSRVISSSWPDLTRTSQYNYFSIEGHLKPNGHDRRFYINKLYKGCPGDLGHMMVSNTVVTFPVCTFDSHATYPQFIYSKINSVDYFQRRMFGTADYMAIFIKA